MRLHAYTLVLFSHLLLCAFTLEYFGEYSGSGDKPGTPIQSQNRYKLRSRDQSSKRYVQNAGAQKATVQNSTVEHVNLFVDRSQSPTPYVQNATFSTVDKWYGIIQWTALGDSYATGVGVGDSLGYNGCAKYSDAYPLLMNNDPRLPGTYPDRRLWNCACSGATSQQILDTQFLDEPIHDAYYGLRPEFGFPQMATLSLGGDDIDFFHLVVFCVYQLCPNNYCQNTIYKSRQTLEDAKWTNTVNATINKALQKGRAASGDGFALFVTSYAKFFNNETTQCNDVNFAYWGDSHSKHNKNANLQQELRTQLNLLVSDVNALLQAIVKSNPGVMFADIDPLFEGHRFCEPGVTEPDNNNPNIWFFHPNTDGNGRNQQFDQLLAAHLDPNGNATAFEANLNATTDPLTTQQSLKDLCKDPSYDYTVQLGINQTVSIQSGVLHLIRGFHPTRVALDAIVTKIFSVFPNWPSADPWVAGDAMPSAVAYDPNNAPPDQRAGPPPSSNTCHTFKDCPSCPQGQSPACDATYQISVENPG